MTRRMGGKPTVAKSMTWVGEDFIRDVLRRLGPGICTTTGAGNRSVGFDISGDGRFGTAPGQDPLICARLYGMFMTGGSTAVVVRTFTGETVSVRHGTEKNRLIRVPVKELRGYRVWVAEEKTDRVFLDFAKIPPDVLRECYSYDARTGEYTGLVEDERDHRFL